MSEASLSWALKTLARHLAEAGVTDERLDVAASRAALRRIECEDPPDVRIERSHLAGVPCWLVRPRDAPRHTILYVHGGGYVAGNFDSHRQVATWLSHSTGMRLVFPEYRLAPEHKFPAAVNDVFGCYGELACSLAKEGGQLLLAGDSAGANLVLVCLIRAREEGVRLAAGAVLACGMFDLCEETSSVLRVSQRSREMALAYLADASQAREPLVSAIRSNLSGLPPMLVQAGGADRFLDDSRRIAAVLKAHGVHSELRVWPGMFHVWHRFAPRLPEAMGAIEEAATFLKGCTQP